MALLNCHNPLASLLPSTNRPSPWRPQLAVAVSLSAVFRSRIGPYDLYRRAVFVVGGGGRDGALTLVRAGAETDAAGPGDGGESVGESGEAIVPVERLPLESKVKDDGAEAEDEDGEEDPAPEEAAGPETEVEEEGTMAAFEDEEAEECVS